MKKALALLLAVAATMSIGVTALAEDVTSSSSEASSSEAASSEVSSSEVSSSEASSAVVSSTPDTTNNQAPIANPTALVFGNDADGAVLGTTMLEPGTEYKFPVSLTNGTDTAALTAADLDTYKFTYSKLSSNGVKTFKIQEYKGVYYLYVEAKESTPVKPIDVKYNVKLVKKADNLSVFAQEVKFSYGYDEFNGDYINGLSKGDVVEIDNAKPVITDTQFEKIAKINDYKNVTLSGNSWKFTVNVTDETTKNMISSNAGIKEILAKFPDQEFKFFNFAGKPTFSATGRVALDVEDIAEDFADMYTYRYADGKLYRLNASFNEEDNTLEFRTNTLNNFVVTDQLIEDGTVITESTGTDSSTPATDDKTNPGTGSSDMINVAVMAAIASLAAAGAVAVKKSSK